MPMIFSQLVFYFYFVLLGFNNKRINQKKVMSYPYFNLKYFFLRTVSKNFKHYQHKFVKVLFLGIEMEAWYRRS